MKDYDALKKAIFERRSVRQYAFDKCDIFEDGVDLCQRFELVPLFRDMNYKITMLKDGLEVKNKKVPYCIGFFCDSAMGSLENIGFVGQQLSLELHNLGIATCWWGLKKPVKEHRAKGGLECNITMMAGLPKESLTRVYPDGFSRVELDKMFLGEADENGLVEAVRIAPSAVNRQPWLVEKNQNVYNFYLKKPKAIIDKVIGKVIGDNMQRVDLGIAISHLYIAAKAAGYSPEIKADGQNMSDATYVASIVL